MTKKKERKFNTKGAVIITVLLLAAAGIISVLQNYWNDYKDCNAQIYSKISQLQSSHNELASKQSHLEQRQQITPTPPSTSSTGSDPVIATEQPVDTAQTHSVQLAPNKDEIVQQMQQLYYHIDDLSVVKNKPGKPEATKSPKSKKNRKNNFADEVLDDMKSIVTVSKREHATVIRRASSSMQMDKLQLKLLVNEMRWAWLYQDLRTFEQSIASADQIVRKNFDRDNATVKDVLNILKTLDSYQNKIGDN